VYPDGPDRAKVDVLHPEHERPNSVALYGCERCLHQLEKATHLHERLAWRRQDSSTASEESPEALALRLAQPSSVFVRVMELYNTRLFRARSGAIVTLGRFQDTIETMRGGTGRGTMSRPPSISSEATSAASPTSPKSGAGGQSLVRTAVKYQADLDYYYEELTTVASRVRSWTFAKTPKGREEERAEERGEACLAGIVDTNASFFPVSTNRRPFAPTLQIARLMKSSNIKAGELRVTRNIVTTTLLLYTEHIGCFR
jgi:hypothetical protein